VFISKVLLHTRGITRAFTASLIAQTLGIPELSFYRSGKATVRRVRLRISQAAERLSVSSRPVWSPSHRSPRVVFRRSIDLQFAIWRITIGPIQSAA